MMTSIKLDPKDELVWNTVKACYLLGEVNSLFEKTWFYQLNVSSTDFSGCFVELMDSAAQVGC